MPLSTEVDLGPYDLVDLIWNSYPSVRPVKFRGDRSNRCGDIAIFRFFKMAAAAAIFDFQNVEI